MKKYAADNLLFLREQYPQIYKLVRNRTGWQEKFLSEPSKNGQPNLLARKEDGYGFHLYSKYDPGVEAARWAQSLDASIVQSNDVLMIGLGLGYHLAAFLEVYPDKRVYLYESSLDLLLAAIETVDLRPVLENRQVVMFAVGDEEPVITELLIGMYKSLKSAFTYTMVPIYRKLIPDLKERTEQLIKKKALGYTTDINTISHHAKSWIENQIVNLQRVLRTSSFYPLKDMCQGVPAVIVGSGPSLGEEIEWLRKLTSHVVIIAAGTAVKGLLHYGIEPHLIVSMDPGVANYQVYKDIDIGHIPFVFITTIHHQAVRDDRSPYVMHGFFDIDVISRYLLDLRTEDGVLLSSGTVTGTAIQLAIFMQCSEIVFIGQDFSYPDKRIYADGVKISSNWKEKQLSTATLTVKNMKGDYNHTNHAMLHLKQDVEEIIMHYPDVPFYNASPVGAVIERTKPKSLEQLLVQTEQYEIASEWFKDNVRERLVVFPQDRRIKVLNNIRNTVEQLQDFQKKLNGLLEHLDVPIKRETEWFVRFERIWSAILDQPIYKSVLWFYVTKERTFAERYWAEMVSETDWNEKYNKLRQCVKPLADGLIELTSFMMGLIQKLSYKLDNIYIE